MESVHSSYNNNAIDILEEFIHDYPENVFVKENFKIANSYFRKFLKTL